MSHESRLLNVVRDLSFRREMTHVIEVLRDAARDLTGADGVTVVLREGDLCHYVDESAISPLWKGRRFSMRACISGWCMLHQEQVAIPDIYEDDRIPHDAYRPTFVRSLAMTPIRPADPIGAIGAYWADRHEATEEELGLLQELGEAAALAIENTRMIEALTEADRRKEQFLAMLAHELRNPLAPIFAGLHLLQSEATHHEPVRRAGAMVERQLRHLTKIVDDLLDVSRVTSGKVTLDRGRTDLAEEVRSTVADWRTLLEAAGVEVYTSVPEAPVWVYGDSVRLTQALGNVLDNARKFTPIGGEVRIRLDVDEHTSLAEVTVQDTGRGIAPEALPYVFDPLAQEDTSLDRSSGGLGLGLSIAKGLIEKHGGTIEIESEGPDRGTLVRISVPRQPELPAVDLDRTPATKPQFSGRVLVVDDNPDAADSLRLILEMWGYEVRVAHTGAEGISQARNSRPEIVLCDIGLPEVDGYAVARALREDDGTRNARLIAITGYGREEDRERSIASGFDLHLVKPVDPDLLLRELRPKVA